RAKLLSLRHLVHGLKSQLFQHGVQSQRRKLRVEAARELDDDTKPRRVALRRQHCKREQAVSALFGEDERSVLQHVIAVHPPGTTDPFGVLQHQLTNSAEWVVARCRRETLIEARHFGESQDW